jgi:Family of unknown function (DUF5691)
MLQTALMGTEKMPPQPDMLPEALRERAGPVSAADREGWLLRAAALDLTWRQGGQLAIQPEWPVNAPADPENAPYCPPELLVLWSRIRALREKWPVLERYWMACCAKNGWIVPPALLPELLPFAVVPPKKNTATPSPDRSDDPVLMLRLLRQIGGARGRWLARHWPDAEMLSAEHDTRQWQEGNIEQRVAALRRCRLDDPALARQWVAATWAQEPTDRKMLLLAVLCRDLSADDAPWLEEAYAVLLQTDNRRAPIQQLKNRLIAALLSVPGHSLRTAWQQQFALNLGRRRNSLRAVLGGQHLPALQLPAAPDDFWNTDILHVQTGLSAPRNGAPFAETARQWFGELVGFVPPSLWCAAADTDVVGLLAFFQNDREFHKTEQALLLRNLAQAAVEHRDANAAAALLQHLPEIPGLLSVAPSAATERHLMGDGRDVDLHVEWSPEFSQFMLRRLYESWGYRQFQRLRELWPFMVYLHPSTAPDRVTSPRDDLQQRERWLSEVVPELERTLAIKRALAQWV